MTEFEFTYEQPAWVSALEALRGGSIPAGRFLALMEGETEEEMEDALLYLESARIALDPSDLPRAAGTGQAAQRLHWEAEQVKAGTLEKNLEENDPLRLYLNELEANPVTGDPQAMARRFAGGFEPVLPALTGAMLPVVVEMAKKMTGFGVLLLDLIQEGSLGLWQGILSFREGNFQEHARWWIAQYLAKAVTLQAREAGVGQRMKQAMEDYRAIDERLLSELGRNPTVEEIAAELHMSVDETEAVARMLEAARLLQRAKPEEKPEKIDPEASQAVENTAYFQMRQRISEMLSVLEETDAKLLSLRFGLDGGAPMSPAEVGKRLHLTAEKVTAREAAALTKLRDKG